MLAALQWWPLPERLDNTPYATLMLDRHGRLLDARIAEDQQWRFVPVAQLPDKYLFAPWTAPQAVLDGAGVRLGETYPRPVVDLKQSREAALAAFARLRDAS